MNLQEIRLAPTVSLMNELTTLLEKGNQTEANIISYELACRLYVPFNKETSFEDMLLSFGYRPKEVEQSKTKGLK